MSRAQVLPEDAGVNLRQQTTNRENRSERSKSLVFACVVTVKDLNLISPHKTDRPHCDGSGVEKEEISPATEHRTPVSQAVIPVVHSPFSKELCGPIFMGIIGVAQRLGKFLVQVVEQLTGFQQRA